MFISIAVVYYPINQRIILQLCQCLAIKMSCLCASLGSLLPFKVHIDPPLRIHS